MAAEEPALLDVPEDGDCGFFTAAWLLTQVPLYAASPKTSDELRDGLVAAWRKKFHLLDIDSFDDEEIQDLQAFIRVRIDQAPKATSCATLAEQAEAVLTVMSKGAGSGELPYWLVFDDFRMLSESFQVDFVVHDIPSMKRPLHTGDGVELHVQWRSGTGSSKHWGHWQPIGPLPEETDTLCNPATLEVMAASPSAPVTASPSVPLARRRRSVEEDLELQAALAASLQEQQVQEDQHLQQQMLQPQKGRRSSMIMDPDELVGVLLDFGIDFDEAAAVAHASEGDMRLAMGMLERPKDGDTRIPVGSVTDVTDSQPLD